ncbi:MAG: 5'-nucleotidase C-terminal domain-containing protein [Oligoflexia bacterium]|nr:5'-nucleotidase C-terminal domain-containing protein [Oligoflexia bacterium]
MTIAKWVSISLVLTIISGCASLPLDPMGAITPINRNKEATYTYNGPVYSEPEWNAPTTETTSDSPIINPDIKRIVVASTNDLHGSIDGNIEEIKIDALPSNDSDQNGTNKKEVAISVGGANIIAEYYKILRKKYGNELLLLDAGDMYSGSLISDSFKGESVVAFYNYLNYDAVTMGNHEFDYGPETLDHFVPSENEDAQGALRKLVKISKAPFVVGNIVDLSTGKYISWPGAVPYLLKEINGVKVGIIAATTTTTTKKTISARIRGLYFEDINAAILKGAHAVKELGAQIVLLLIHEGHHCKQSSSGVGHPAEKYASDKGTINTDKVLCDAGETDGELYSILNKLPPQSVDAVVSGHTHTGLYHFLHGIPTIQAFSKGQYFSKMELYYDNKNKKFLPEKTVLHAPIKFCEKFFASSNDCYRPDPKKAEIADQMIPARFLGEKIAIEAQTQKEVDQVLGTYRKAIEKKSKEIIFDLSVDLTSEPSHQESDLGVMLADAFRFVAKADIGVINSGGIRGGFNKGPVTFADVYRAFPFANLLAKLPLSGKQIEELVRIGVGKAPQGPGLFSGLKIWLKKNRPSSESVGMNANAANRASGRVQLIKVTLADGTPLVPEKTYSVASNDFLALYLGDGFGGVFQEVSDDKKEIFAEYTYHDVFIKYVQHLRNTKQQFHTSELPYKKFTTSEIIWVD